MDDERERELEALEAIYMHDLTIIDRPSEFHIKILPIPDSENPEDNKGPRYPPCS